MEWGIIAANRVFGMSEVTANAQDLGFVVKARTDLIKKRNQIIMQRKNRSN